MWTVDQTFKHYLIWLPCSRPAHLQASKLLDAERAGGLRDKHGCQRRASALLPVKLLIGIWKRIGPGGVWLCLCTHEVRGHRVSGALATWCTAAQGHFGNGHSSSAAPRECWHCQPPLEGELGNEGVACMGGNAESDSPVQEQDVNGPSIPANPSALLMASILTVCLTWLVDAA